MWGDEARTFNVRGGSRRSLFLYLVLSFFILLSDVRYQYLLPVRSALATMTYPLVALAGWQTQAMGTVSDWWVSRQTLKEENQQLREWQSANAWQINSSQSLRDENRQLRAMLELRANKFPKAVAADVVALTRDSANQLLILNRGARDGLISGRGVVVSQGVLGQVVRVWPFHSEVALVNHPRHATSVKFSRTGVYGVAVGGRRGVVTMPYVPLQNDVVVGDELVTSGLDGIYPSGLPVMRITAVDKDNSGFFYVLTGTPLAIPTQNQALILDYPQPTDEEKTEKTELEDIKRLEQGVKADTVSRQNKPITRRVDKANR